MGDRSAFHVHIEGRVQGVGYRYWLIDQATSLGLDGWVRNRRDGRVEAVIAGSAWALKEILVRCHDGPLAARVERVTADPDPEPDTAEVEPGFHALPTV